MKKKLTLTIDDKLINYIKHIALDEGMSVSEMFEEYIISIKKSNKNVIAGIRSINISKQLCNSYCNRENSKKYDRCD